MNILMVFATCNMFRNELIGPDHINIWVPHQGINNRSWHSSGSFQMLSDTITYTSFVYEGFSHYLGKSKLKYETVYFFYTKM